MEYSWYWKIYGANPTNFLSYINVGSAPPNCLGTTHICAIYAQNNGLGYPIINSIIRAAMITALTYEVNQPLVLLREID